MHIFGSCILAAFYIGPKMALSGIILSIFGWYFLPFEAIGASAIFEFYKPNIEQNIYRTFRIGFIIGILSAIIFSPFIPKEEGREIICWVGSATAVFSSVIFSFLCIHTIKINKMRTE